jgi:formamidopyrimidine-DNA glycosylase
MPELPEVETVRRALEGTILGRTIASVELSGLKLRAAVSRDVPRRLAGRTFRAARRHGKYLLIDFDGDLTMISHLGMSGRWLFWAERPAESMPHLHARFRLRGGGELWFQDPRRFGLLRLVSTPALARDPALRILGPDPLVRPPEGDQLHASARGLKVEVKNFLMDQRRIAGIGNIYASEILFRAGVNPKRRAGAVTRPQWAAVAREIPAVLGAAAERMGTTFSMYRTLWNEPGTYGNQLMVYDRAGKPCRTCGTPIRRVVQGARSTYFCPSCQGAGRAGSPGRGRPGVRTRPRNARSDREIPSSGRSRSLRRTR